MLNLNLGARVRWARSLATDAGVGLIASPQINVPHTDSRTIFMPMLSSEWQENSEDVSIWEAILWHEVCHLRHKEDFKLLRRLKLTDGDIRAHILNIVVDSNIEHVEYGVLPGRDIIADASIRWACKKFKPAPADVDESVHKIIGLQAFSLVSRLSWCKHLEEFDIAMDISDKSKETMQMLLEEPGLLEEYSQKRKDGDPNWELTLKLFKLLKLTEPPENQQPQQGKGTPEKECKDGSQPQAGQPQGKGENNETESSSGGKDGEEETEDTAPIGAVSNESENSSCKPPTEFSQETIIVDYEQIKKYSGSYSPQHLTQLKEEKKQLHTKYDANKDCRSRDGYLPAQFNILSPTQSDIESTRGAGYLEDEINRLIAGSTIHKNIRRELQALSQASWEGNKSKGRIHAKKMACVALSLNNRPFKQKRTRQLLNTAICLMVDTSGSMDGTPYIHAAAGAIMMSECFSALGIATEIIGYTAHRGKPHYLVHKDYATRGRAVTDLVGSFLYARKFMGNTPDGESTLFGLSRLAKRKEKRKMIFVLSDGSPCFPENQSGDIYKFTRDVIRSIEANPKFEIYGIGIMDENPRFLYKDFIIINRANSLETELLTLIKKKILR